MKIILFGATGQLGREWQDFLQDDIQQKKESIELLTYSSSDLDLTGFDAVSEELRNLQPDLIINCAAYTDVDGAEKHQSTARRVNAGAVIHLATLSRVLDFKIIHYSTDYVFPGHKKDRERLPEGYPEDHPADPINSYGQTKWEGEQAIRNSTGDHLILRVSWLCGQYGSNFVKTMLKLGHDRDELKIVNDQWGSPTFAREVVENSWTLIQAGQQGTFHITSEGLTSWYDFARAIFEMEGIDVAVKPVSSELFPTKAPRPRFSKLNTSKLSGISGSRMRPWRDSLSDMLRRLNN